MARSSERGVGNTPRDQASIDWMIESGRLSVIDAEEEGLPWPAKYQWDGDAETEGSPWAIPPEGKRCVGKAFLRDEDGDYVVDANNERIKRPCYSWPIKGATVCIAHGGGLTGVKKAAQRRLADALDAVTGRLVRIALSPNTSDQDAIRAVTQIMDRLGIKSGINIDTAQPGWREALKAAFEGKED